MVEPSNVATVSVVIAFYVTEEILRTILLVAFSPQYKVVDAAFEAASALATTGLSVGITSASVPVSTKGSVNGLNDSWTPRGNWISSMH